ncbi:hypothetical protein [Pseudomonas chlororaphis]|uniref:Uncharacterized protein n=1 Tax=Pseudomonas chlororaphis TaxID=587753 RepID=A0A1Q8EPF8_9PSED|nr:hypothetical protein [Pseudomonas chlororaphis]OLF53677.1 hypothetical protein BTN82_15535 [Pseudomonas chlororaphis]
MPIIYRATKDIVRSIDYGIALGTGDKGYTDMVSDFLGNVVSNSIADGVNQLNASQQVYWSPYVEIPNLGNVYSLPSTVTNGTTLYSFYQGQTPPDPGTQEWGPAGSLNYSVKTLGAAISDQLCEMNFFTVNSDPAQGPHTPSPPAGVVFDGKVYAFYGTPDDPTSQLYYTVYDADNWSTPEPVPGITTGLMGFDNPAPVAPVVFTPPGSQSPLLYVFYFIESGDSQLDIACTSTADGKSWTPVAPNGIGAASIDVSQNVVSPVVYAPPGGTEQIYLFFCATPSGTYTTSYITYPDASTDSGFSAPTEITTPGLPSNFCTFNGATLYTPAGATAPQLYVFVSGFSYVTGTFSDYVPEDELGYYDATDDSTFYYQVNGISYTTFDGNTWSAYEQVPNATWTSCPLVSRPSATVFPPASFNDNLSSAADIYFSTVQSAQPNYGLPGSECCAAFVGGLSQYSAGTEPSAVTSYPAYSFYTTLDQFVGVAHASLLAVDLPGLSVPQPWLLYNDFSSATQQYQMSYAIYGQSGWVSYPLPTIVVPPATNTPLMIGSPALLPVPTGVQDYPAQGLMVFNSASGLQAAITAPDPSSWDIAPVNAVPAASESPSLALFNSQAYLFYQGAGSQAGQLWYTQSDPTVFGDNMPALQTCWSSPVQVPGVSMSNSPSTVVFGDTLYVFYQGPDGNGQLWYASWAGSGTSWSAPVQVVPSGLQATGALLSCSPSACVYTDPSGDSVLFVAYAGAGTSGNYPLSYCTLGADNSWAQGTVSNVFIIDSPTVYSVAASVYSSGASNAGSSSAAGRLNVFFQPAASSNVSPGQLFYCVYNGTTWSSTVGTTPVTALDGWVSGIMYQNSESPDGNNDAFLYLLHNNSGANAGQLSYCQCSVSSSGTGMLVTGECPVMANGPAATIANDDIYVFYNSTYQETGTTTWVSGALAYLQIPLPADTQEINLGTYPQTAVGCPSPYPGTASEALTSGSGFIAMVNSPAAATLQGTPYVFFNTGKGEIGYCSDVTSVNTKTLVSGSVAADCTPAAVACNNVLYVFWVASGSDNTGALQCSYTLDGATWNALDFNPALSVNTEGVITTVCDGLVYLIYNLAGVTSYVILPQVSSSQATQTLDLAPSTPISRMGCCTGPCVAVFDNNLWCVSQGVESSNYSPLGGWKLTPNGDLFFSRTLDALSWSWNTGINQAAGEQASWAMPVATAFAQPGGSELLYVFWIDSGDNIRYVTTDGTYVTPSSSAYGLPWSGPNNIIGGATSNLAVVAMPPLDSPGDPDQLYVFGQTEGHIYYVPMNASGEWVGGISVVPSGCNAQDAYMSLSPSVAYYAPEGGTPQPYVFYQQAGSSTTVGKQIGLSYCVYDQGAWTQNSVPNISTTVTGYMDGIAQSPITYTGIDAGTPPRAIVFNDKLYVFYVTKNGGYGESNSGKWSAYTTFPVSFSTFDGTSWSGLNTIGSTQGTTRQENDITANCYAQFVYPVVFNETLYLFYMSGPGNGFSPPVDPPGSIYLTSTSDGANWTDPQPTTNVVYVPGGSTTVENQTGTEINDTLTAVNGALSFVGLPTTSDIRDSIASGVIGVFF